MATGIRENRHNVEPGADMALMGGFEIILGNKRYLALFLQGDGMFGGAKGGLGSGLDLDKGKGVVIARDDIDFSQAGTIILFDDLISLPLEIDHRQRFTVLPENLYGIDHDFRTPEPL